MHPSPRRQWLQHTALLVAAGTPWARAWAALGQARAPLAQRPLRPATDESTGLPLLWLPEGLRYRSFAWTGEPMSGSAAEADPAAQRLPGAADGMGIVLQQGQVFTLVRNHERTGAGGSFGPLASQYDPPCAGGTVTLRWDRAAGRLLEARASLGGTLTNCAGGVTPWGSWLSCEEIVSPVGHRVRGSTGSVTLDKPHGFVFEVPAEGPSDAQPLTALGQMVHEAAVVDPADGTVYLTEDQPLAGFYRCLPSVRGRLAAGGRLQMLRARGAADLRRGLRQGQRFDVDWVDIERPEDARPDSTQGRDGLLRRGVAQGASVFTRLEGVFINGEDIWFTATDGGDAGAGQIWRYRSRQRTLELFLESPAAAAFDYPDNLCLRPDGRLLVFCEDSKQPVQRLYALRPDDPGSVFELARSDVRLSGEVQGHRGDFRGAEWAGACFSSDGRSLFVNNYRPGFTLEIFGDWGALGG